MSNARLDQIVKGTPISTPPTLTSISDDPSDTDASRPATPTVHGDGSAPQNSSQCQVYMNLLILEESLRAQYLSLRDRRRQNIFFLLLLCFWNVSFGYLLFLKPREDGSGIGGSVYWVVENAEKMALMGGVVTGLLIWGTGQWERGVRWPRRWVAVANRGLKVFNAKVVIIRRPWWRELIGHLIFLFPYTALFHSTLAQVPTSGSFGDSSASSQDLNPGGDHIKLLLLPKPFSPDFRENWELYRMDYWEKENDRRAKLKHLYQKREKEIARRRGNSFGWFAWRGRTRGKSLSQRASRGASDAAGRALIDRSGRRRHQDSVSARTSNVSESEGSLRARTGSAKLQPGRRRRTKLSADKAAIGRTQAAV